MRTMISSLAASAALTATAAFGIPAAQGGEPSLVAGDAVSPPVSWTHIVAESVGALGCWGWE